nr:hypothetical protein Iba_chr13aCG12680 [Ipomoea batatas]GMD75205.1 hypothetical protein Iba_chr13aCG12690 [Ipomoea batatas]GMD82713.1 hypothetical protein Iba_chr13fCG10690 [Ipomoea batatas]
MAANQKFVAVFLMFMVALSSMQVVPVSANFMESRSTTFKASDVEGAAPTLVASKKVAAEQDTVVDPMMSKNT